MIVQYQWIEPRKLALLGVVLVLHTLILCEDVFVQVKQLLLVKENKAIRNINKVWTIRLVYPHNLLLKCLYHASKVVCHVYVCQGINVAYFYHFSIDFCNCAESVVNCESHNGGNWNCLTNLQTYHYSMIFMLVYKFYIWPEGKFFKIYSTLYLYHDAISPLIC